MEFNKDVTLELHALCSHLTKTVKSYYRDPAHRKEFEETYRRKYGKEYIWRSRNES